MGSPAFDPFAKHPDSDDAPGDPSALPVRNSMWPNESYKSLDAGIRFAVRVLHADGIETCQSCEGGEGHAYDRPTIDMIAGPSDSAGLAAVAALWTYGLPVYDLSKVWPIKHGMPYEFLWRVTFSAPCPERADDLPMFVKHYQYNADLAAREASETARPEDTR